MTLGPLSSKFVVAIAAITAIGVSFFNGLYRGHNGFLDGAMDIAAPALAIAISESYYGQNRGYVGYKAVQDSLQKDGLTTNPALLEQLGRSNLDVISNPALINTAIANALSIPVPSSPTFKGGDLITLVANEFGIVDYYKLSFKLFGYRVEATYYPFYLMLLISAVCYLVAFWQRPIYLVFLLTFLTANTIFATDSNFWNVANFRYMAVLALIPTIQILFVMADDRSINFRDFISTILQIAIFIFIFHVRMSVGWVFPMFAITGIVLLLKRRRQFRTRAALLSNSAVWPILALCAGISVFTGYLKWHVNEAYSWDDFLPHHMVYHSPYLGLAVHPNWYERFGHRDEYQTPSPYNGGVADALAGNLVFNDIRNTMRARLGRPVTQQEVLAEYISPYSHTYKTRMHDRIMKKKFFEFIEANPRFAVEAVFYKLYFFAIYVKENLNILLICIVSAVFYIFGLFGWKRSGSLSTSEEVVNSTAALAGLCIFSLIPIVVAYPLPHVMSEQLIIWTMTAILLVGFALEFAFRIFKRKPAITL